MSERQTLDGVEVVVSGWYFSTASAVGPTQTETNYLDGVLLIKAFPAFPSKRTSRQIDMNIMVPLGIDRIDFGKLGVTIWRRPDRTTGPDHRRLITE